MTETRKYDDIEEIVEAGRRHVNVFLQHCYRLLAITEKDIGRHAYVEKDALYVLGRTAAIEPLGWAEAHRRIEAAEAVWKPEKES